MAPDPHLKWVVTLMVLVQMVACYLVKDLPWKWVFFWTYTVGGYVSHSLTLAIHEISHNVAFGNKRPTWNSYFNMFANLPIGIPIAATFKKYHIDHHRYLAGDRLDVDLPTYLECRLFNTSLGKLIWVFLQPLCYALRPLFVRPKPVSQIELINISVQLGYDLLIFYSMGTKSLIYMLASVLFTSGFNLITGHFIAEHYEYGKGCDTVSYYGPLNRIALNAGHHVEHHDFPSIPGSKLPLVKKIAPEYYDSLPYHYSWGVVIWNFIFKADQGPSARVKRQYKFNHSS
ncbi:PREDICTED: sphingolipid delta(4)-desaturase/C4-monooxygenase DES2-like [Gekko japonicus]|uniref:Sphingolipid delta(4)-desaturase/C4-monooxygenase DES2-like n=1 Tax=Gekko japonicus TaxID=146911 RepID=A0ABM1KL73_GEKJA|nr:PREDICTED: sphingolipid delta(4)-desaturase/C4-monooxygenase DES2-like [Gekko japonicus]